MTFFGTSSIIKPGDQLQITIRIYLFIKLFILERKYSILSHVYIHLFFKHMQLSADIIMIFITAITFFLFENLSIQIKILLKQYYIFTEQTKAL